MESALPSIKYLPLFKEDIVEFYETKLHSMGDIEKE